MPSLDAILKLEKEDRYFAYTAYRKYFVSECTGMFMKRTLRKSELQRNIKGEIISPGRVFERSKNEAAALIFLGGNSTVPVPKVYREYELDGAHCIIMEYIEGDLMADLEEGSKPAVMKELQDHIKSMHTLSALRMGGVFPPGFVCLPPRVSRAARVDEDKLIPFQSDRLVFCHNDLSQHNVLVQRDTHKIQAIIDFEFSGFYPSFFEGHFYRRLGPSIALEGEEDDTDQLIDFLNCNMVRNPSYLVSCADIINLFRQRQSKIGEIPSSPNCPVRFAV
jgi:tRNA A-37 threonylcarbamoyl transferase component Bud32